MPLHPAAQQMIRKVEELSGRPVHMAEDADLKVLASICRVLVLRDCLRLS